MLPGVWYATWPRRAVARPEATERDRWLAAVGALPGVLAYRVEVLRGAQRQLSAPIGHADCIFVARGVVVAVEWKSDRGRQSDGQRAWQRAWEAAGGVYLLARDAGQCCRDLSAATGYPLAKVAESLDVKKV